MSRTQQIANLRAFVKRKYGEKPAWFSPGFGDSLLTAPGGDPHDGLDLSGIAWEAYGSNEIRICKPLSKNVAGGRVSPWSLLYGWAEGLWEFGGIRCVVSSWGAGGTGVLRESRPIQWDFRLPMSGNLMVETDYNGEDRSLIVDYTLDDLADITGISITHVRPIWRDGMTEDGPKVANGDFSASLLTDNCRAMFEWCRDTFGADRLYVLPAGYLGLDATEQAQYEIDLALPACRAAIAAADDGEVIMPMTELHHAGTPFNTLTVDEDGLWVSGGELVEYGHPSEAWNHCIGKTAAWNALIREGLAEGDLVGCDIPALIASGVAAN